MVVCHDGGIFIDNTPTMIDLKQRKFGETIICEDTPGRNVDQLACGPCRVSLRRRCQRHP